MHRKMSEQKLNIEFVTEVENYPCIYDYRRADYARKDVIDRAWAKIGMKFNLSGPQCRERWKNLRTVLSRNLRPNESLPNNKSRASKQQRKPYYLFEAMKFAVPFIKSHNTVPSYFRPKELSNSPCDQEIIPEETENDAKEDICHVKVENFNYDQSRSPSPQYGSLPPSPQVSLLEAPSPTPHTPPPPPRPRRSCRDRNLSYDSPDLDMDEYLPKKIKPKKPQKLEDDKVNVDLTKVSRKRFLLSLLADVYSMDNVQMRSFRMKVLNLINEISQTPSNMCSVCQCNPTNFNLVPEHSLPNPTVNQIPEHIYRSEVFRPSAQQQQPSQDAVNLPHTVVEVKIEKDD